MGIQKEREAFEDKFPIPAHWIDFDGLTCKYICKYNAIDDQALKYQARWEAWQAAKAQAVPEVITISNELQSWVAAWSFSAKNDGEDYVVVDANLLAKKIEKLTGAKG